MNWINKLLIKLGLKKPPPPMTTEQFLELVRKATEMTTKKFQENIDRPLFKEDKHER